VQRSGTLGSSPISKSSPFPRTRGEDRGEGRVLGLAGSIEIRAMGPSSSKRPLHLDLARLEAVKLAGMVAKLEI